MNQPQVERVDLLLQCLNLRSMTLTLRRETTTGYSGAIIFAQETVVDRERRQRREKRRMAKGRDSENLSPTFFREIGLGLNYSSVHDNDERYDE